MLKIKDNVDLKVLEKFGFKPRYNEYTGEVMEYYLSEESQYDFKIKKLGITTTLKLSEILRRLFKINRYYNCWIIKIRHYSNFTDVALDLLYDLTKTGLVEKVGEHNVH